MRARARVKVRARARVRVTKDHVEALSTEKVAAVATWGLARAVQRHVTPRKVCTWLCVTHVEALSTEKARARMKVRARARVRVT